MPVDDERRYFAFRQYATDFKGWSPRTRYKYECVVRRADEWMRRNRDTRIWKARPKDLEAFLFSTARSARNRNNVRQALVAYGHFLVYQGLAELNPARDLPRLSEPQLMPKALPVDQARRIMRSAEAYGPREAVLVALLLYGGLRRTEVRLLEWRHIDLDDGWVRFIGKGAKERTVALQPQGLRAVRRWKGMNPDPCWVFPSPRVPNKPMSETYLKDLIRVVGEFAGIEGLHPHLLRHTSATRLLEQGADLRTAQEFLGHSDPKTTAIYTRIRPARIKEAVERLDFEGQGDANDSLLA